ACTSTSTDKDTPYRWIDGVENEGKSHILLPNYSTQRECCHVRAFVDYSTLYRVHAITNSHAISTGIACYHMKLSSVKMSFNQEVYIHSLYTSQEKSVLKIARPVTSKRSHHGQF